MPLFRSNVTKTGFYLHHS